MSQSHGEASPTQGRFWCRIEAGRWIGGVCLGVAAYGHFRVDWVRTVTLLLALVTGGIIAIVYLLLLLLPAISTMEEYERRRLSGLGAD